MKTVISSIILALVCYLNTFAISDTIVPIKNMNLSPFYMAGQNPETGHVVSEIQVQRIIERIAPYVENVKTFSTAQGNEHIPYHAKMNGLGVILGVYIDADISSNLVQLEKADSLIELDYVDKVVIGTEVLLNNDTLDQILIEYINDFKLRWPNIPVTTAEQFEVLCNFPDVIDAVTFVSFNVYGYWSNIPLSCNIQFLDDAYNKIKQLAQGKDIYIMETGYRTSGNLSGGLNSVPSLANSIKYNIEVLNWIKAHEDADVVLFSVIDEPWKSENDDYWGWWQYNSSNDSIELKPGFEVLFEPIEDIDSSWLCEIPPIDGTDTIVLDFIPPYQNAEYRYIKGHINYLNPCNLQVALYVRNILYYPKPTYDQPTIQVNCDGSFDVLYWTNWHDSNVDQMCIFLLSEDYTPPQQTQGLNQIPTEVYQNAISHKCINLYHLDSGSVSIEVSTNEVCAGSLVTLTANGGNQYFWENNGATTNSINVYPESNTTFTVQIMDGQGGSIEQSQLVSVFQLPDASIISSSENDTICLGDTILLTAEGGTTYQWSNGDLTDFIWLTPEMTDDYYVVATNENTCIDSALITVFVVSCLPTNLIDKNLISSYVTISPNPTNGIFEIKFSLVLSGNADITIYDVLGKKSVYQMNHAISNNRILLNLKLLPNSAYIILGRIKDSKNYFVQQVVIQN